MSRLPTVCVLVALACRAAAAGAGEMKVRNLPRHVDDRTRDAIERTLAHLAAQQGPDGSWAQPLPGGSFAPGTYDVVTTAMVGLAFLAHGDTPDRGTYGANVSLAIHWVLSRADKDTGRITSAGDSPRPMYGHCFAILFLAEACGTEPAERIGQKMRDAIAAGCRVIERAQSGRGGWNYDWAGTQTAHHSQVKNGVLKEWDTEEDDDEGSVTVHAVQALRAAKNAGIPVHRRSIDRGLAYLVSCQGKDGGIRYKFGSGSGSKSEPAISAAASTAFAMCGVYPPKSGGTAVERAARQCREYVDRAFGCGGLFPEDVQYYPFYAQLYLAQAKWFAGGAKWDAYYPAIRDWLLADDNKYRHPNQPVWAGDTASGSTYYSTAAALLILQMPWAMLPIWEK